MIGGKQNGHGTKVSHRLVGSEGIGIGGFRQEQQRRIVVVVTERSYGWGRRHDGFFVVVFNLDSSLHSVQVKGIFDNTR